MSPCIKVRLHEQRGILLHTFFFFFLNVVFLSSTIEFTGVGLFVKPVSGESKSHIPAGVAGLSADFQSRNAVIVPDWSIFPLRPPSCASDLQPGQVLICLMGS